MKKALYISVSIVIAAILLVIGYAVYWLWLPGIDVESLEIRLKPYREMTEQWAQRPAEDREKLGALLHKFELLVTDDLNFPKYFCGENTQKAIADYKKNAPGFEKFFQGLDPVLAGGLVIREDVKQLENPDDFGRKKVNIPRLLFSLVLSGIMHAGTGNSELAVKRFGQSLAIADGMLDSPTLINFVIAKACYQAINQGLVFCLPSLRDQDIRAVQKHMKGQKTLDNTVVDAAFAETVFGDYMVQFALEDSIKNLRSARIAPRRLIDLFFDRERKIYLDYSIRNIAAFQDWLKGNSDDKPDESKLSEDLPYGLMVRMMAVKLGRFFEQAIQVGRETKAVKSAIEEWVQSPGNPGSRSLDINFEKKGSIVIDNEAGCLSYVDES